MPPNLETIYVSLLTTALSVDRDALIGAIAGAALAVFASRRAPRSHRLADLITSCIAGYLAAPEVIATTPLTSMGLAAFFSAAVARTITLRLIEHIKSFDLISLFKKK